METFTFALAVCGYHVFKDLFKPSIGEKLVAKREFNNTMDKHAVKVVKGDESTNETLERTTGEQESGLELS